MKKFQEPLQWPIQAAKREPRKMKAKCVLYKIARNSLVNRVDESLGLEELACKKCDGSDELCDRYYNLEEKLEKKYE